VVVNDRADLMAGEGRPFWKMSGSGNDFIFLDARGSDGTDPLETVPLISAMCRPHIGVGADGVVFMDASPEGAFAIRYYNADGTRAMLCGNASLCAAQSAVRLGLTQREKMFSFMSDAGRIDAIVSADGVATIRLAPVTALESEAAEPLERGEQRIGYGVVGVPHLVVLVDDLDGTDVDGRGRTLRKNALRAPAGANVNFVAPDATQPGRWRIRTFERGVEAETYACGTGAVASAALLQAWRLAPSDAAVELKTASDRVLRVQLPDGVASSWSELSGEGRLVYAGELHDLGA
jgi:diaminopimelate epimerase